MQEALDQLSRRIRDWRERLDLSLNELAARSDVSASTIQKIETRQMVPSVAILMKIADGLGRRPSELVGEEGQEDEVVLLRAKDHAMIGDGSRIRVERLSGDLFDPAIEVWRLTIARGYDSGEEKYAYDGEEVVLCEQGEITFSIGKEEFIVGVGDSLHFKSNIPRRWWNSGNSRARFLIIGNFPKGLRSKLHRQIQKGGRKR